MTTVSAAAAHAVRLAVRSDHPGGPQAGLAAGVLMGVVARESALGVRLLEDELHVVRGVGRVVWCDITIPGHTRPVAGAEAAQRVCKYLIDNVLHRRSSWLGLILDVRQGPSVIGPITRDLNSTLFVSAEQARKPFAVVTVAARQIHAQYCELASAHAPRYALVTDSAQRAMDWMTNPR